MPFNGVYTIMKHGDKWILLRRLETGEKRTKDIYTDGDKNAWVYLFSLRSRAALEDCIDYYRTAEAALNTITRLANEYG